MKFKSAYTTALLISIGFFACQGEEKTKKLPFTSKADYEETMIASHKAYLQKERSKISSYIEDSGSDFDSTGTGLRYRIIETNLDGDTLASGEIAVIFYQLKDIEGNLLYETRAELAHEFAVDYDEVESGLHEGIKKMRTGEKAIFILPAHIAHGITGDQAAIPSQTTLVYELYLAGKK